MGWDPERRLKSDDFPKREERDDIAVGGKLKPIGRIFAQQRNVCRLGYLTSKHPLTEGQGEIAQ